VPPLSWFDVRRDAPVCCMYIVAVKSCCPEFDPVRQQWTWTVSQHTRMAWCNVESELHFACHSSQQTEDFAIRCKCVCSTLCLLCTVLIGSVMFVPQDISVSVACLINMKSD
jgi:hypothetical protein